MENISYYGIIHQSNNGTLGISFPDLPGCVSVGDDIAELKKNATESLQLHIDGMVEDGITLPEPSKAISDLTAMKESGCVALIYIKVKAPKMAVKRFNITARESDMQMIDKHLKKLGRGRDRSYFLIQSALEKIRKETGKDNKHA